MNLIPAIAPILLWLAPFQALVAAHPEHTQPAATGLIGEWSFVPVYELPGSARNTIGPRTPYPRAPVQAISTPSAPLLLFGEEPTERVARLVDAGRLPTRSVSLELWTVDHVNQPVGAVAAIKSELPGHEPAAVLAYRDGGVGFIIRTRSGTAELQFDAGEASLKSYWRHIVGTYDGETARLYINGKLRAQSTRASGNLSVPPSADLEIAAYCGSEPYMDLGNIVHLARVFDRALTREEIQSSAADLAGTIERGHLFPGLFHFTAGPYLNYATRDGVRILWESDRPASALVEYGRTAELGERIELPMPADGEDGTIRSVQLLGLDASTPYFYKVTLRDSAGHEIDSGLLTFKTAVRQDEAYSFVVIGDTESRPHINDRIAKLVWDERPDFVVNCGDLTDGGKEPNKFQWTHEYFLGMNQLHSRIPAFPVPGNGEGDLYWYNRYHDLPDPEAYYSFEYGNAEFFMLDSNQRGESFKPGGEQFEWLRERLEASKATWKFVAHHHPTYTSDENDYGDTFEGPSDLGDVRVRRMTELYEAYGVDIVFFGHLHTYERSWPVFSGKVDLHRGVMYVQSGGGGGNLEDFAPNRTWFKHKTHRGHHYCTVNIMQDQLHFKMYDVNGRMLDSFELVR